MSKKRFIPLILLVGIGSIVLTVLAVVPFAITSNLSLDTNWTSQMMIQDTIFRVQVQPGANYTIYTDTTFDESFSVQLSDSPYFLTGKQVSTPNGLKERILIFQANTSIYYILIKKGFMPLSFLTLRVQTGISGTDTGTTDFMDPTYMVIMLLPFIILTVIGTVLCLAWNKLAEKISNAFKYEAPKYTRTIKVKKVSKDPVSIKRQFEYFSGFVRVKVKISNNSSYIITKVEFELEFPKSFQLRKIEPSYRLKGNEIDLDEIPPRSEKTVGFTLEPLICGTENIYGHLEYLDYRGNPKVMAMNPLEVKVVCPLFFTEEEANVAKLTNLITYKLKKNDERSYALPSALKPKEAYDIIKRVVQKHHVKFVSESVQKDPTFEAHAWYYAKTKIKQQDFVIQVIVSEEYHSMKIMVDCDSEISLTGFLSEVGSAVRRKILREGLIKVEDDLVALRCPACAAPLDKLPKNGETMKCSFCGHLITLDLF